MFGIFGINEYGHYMQIFDRTKHGVFGVLDYVKTMTDGGSYWQIASICRALLRVEQKTRSFCNHYLSSFCATSHDIISQTSRTLNWFVLFCK